MKTLPVDLLQLTAALEDQDRHLTTYYFDSQSGEIVLLSEDSRSSDKRWDIILNSVDRFIPIEPRYGQKTPEAMRQIALEWLAAHGVEPVEPASNPFPSLLDQETEALEAQESGEMLDDDLDEEMEDELDEFTEEDDTDIDGALSEDEEAELVDFVESLPGTEFNLAKFHGLLSAFAAGPMIMTPADILVVLTSSAEGQRGSEVVESEGILDLLSRYYGGIVEGLEFESFEPQLQQQGIQVTDPGGAIVSWCNGFMLGIDLHEAEWKSWFADERRAKAISLIVGMSDPDILRQAENSFGEEAAWATANVISELVPLISLYWKFESGLEEYLGPEEDAQGLN